MVRVVLVGVFFFLYFVHASQKQSPIKLMFICGLHGREYATVSLCESIHERLTRINDSRYQWLVIPEANPDGISIARDQGKSCHRGNSKGVDLNRNWPRIRDNIHDYWGELKTWEVNPGSKPFSEYETTYLSKQIEQFAPSLLFDIHTGDCGMLSPYQSIPQIPKNHREHMQISRWLLDEQLNFNLQQCKRGAGITTLYQAVGTMIDYAYEILKVPIVFTLETFITEDANLRYKPTANLTNAECQKVFVPPNITEYVEQWSVIADSFARLSNKEYNLLHSWTKK